MEKEFRVRFPLQLQVSEKLRYAGYDGPEVLNLGAGINPIIGAVNQDLNQSGGIDLLFDLLEPWPVADTSFDKVCAFHVLEHIPVTKVLHIFREACRVLRPGGVFIVEVPDIVGLAKELVAGNYGMLRYIYSGDRHPGDAHRWGYDAAALAAIASTTGFGTLLTTSGTDYHAVQMPTVRLEAVRA